jgi:MFS family permease
MNSGGYMTTPARPRKAPAKKAAAKKIPVKKAAAPAKATTAKKAAPRKAVTKQEVDDVLDLASYEVALDTAIDAAALEGDPIAAPPPPGLAGKKRGGPFAAYYALTESVGAASLTPLFLLLGLSAVERFDAIAFGVLSPELQKYFHLTDAKIASISGLTAAVPILLSVPLGALADRTNRVRLAVIAAFIWGGTAVLTGLAPVLFIFIVARLIGGVGLLINEPVHPSLLADYYPSESLPRVNSWHRQAGTIGLIGGPLAGYLGGHFGWRSTFVVLAIPTFILAFMLTSMKEPARGATFGLNATDEKAPSIREAFKKIRGIRSLRRTWLSAFFFGSGTLPFATFLNLYLKHVFHLRPTGRGVVTAVFGGAGAVGLAMATRFVGQYTVKYGLKALPIVTGGMVVTLGIGVLLMAGAPNIWVAGVFCVIAGIGATGFLPSYLTMVAFVAPPALRSQVFSWSLLFYALGALTFSGIVGGYADKHGERPAFVLLAALVILGGVIEASVYKFVDRDVQLAQEAVAAG